MKKLMILAVLSIMAVVGWRALRSDDAAPTHDDNPVLNRIWIDHMPRSERDMVNIFAAAMEDPRGIFLTSSVWKGHHELFRYEEHEGELRIVFPQNKERERVKARATKCREHDFDYCLELKGASRGVKRYYSREEWVIEGGLSADKLRATVAKLVEIAKLAGAAEQ